VSYRTNDEALQRSVHPAVRAHFLGRRRLILATSGTDRGGGSKLPPPPPRYRRKRRDVASKAAGGPAHATPPAHPATGPRTVRGSDGRSGRSGRRGFHRDSIRSRAISPQRVGGTRYRWVAGPRAGRFLGVARSPKGGYGRGQVAARGYGAISARAGARLVAHAIDRLRVERKGPDGADRARGLREPLRHRTKRYPSLKESPARG